MAQSGSNAEESAMFCFQCEQTFHGSGCVDQGVCGKDYPTASLQDLLIYVTKGLAQVAQRAGKAQGEALTREVSDFVVEALFTTVTNVNFDYADLRDWVHRGVALRERVRAAAVAGGVDLNGVNGASSYQPPQKLGDLVRAGEQFGIRAAQKKLGADIAGLVELYLYGLKGAAAYAEHARRLGYQDDAHDADYVEALAFLGAGEDFTVDTLLGRCLAAGKINYRAMELLDAANTGTYGHPVPTQVNTEAVSGKAILVSGHDLLDLKKLLEQTEGKGINVYTHGEMLPAHGYPELKKHAHLVGHWGGAWQEQAKEFPQFPGAILMTTNCIQRPSGDTFKRIFTSGMVAWPGVSHIADEDFTPVIEVALAQPGFSEDAPRHEITVGFGHNAVLGVAGTVIEAVKSGALKHFFLIGGCDGAKAGRNYYTKFAEAVPEDCAILTLACGKFRFNKKDFGTIGGLPRLLDIGQCNDAYSALQIAMALAKAFECEVNDLPLSMIISWYEQKAVAVLLTLLHLGIKNIRLGPSLPAFVTPAVLNVLVETFALAPIGEKGACW